jgi:radical SAM superfamily enzyme with C-terminal helix-hairpin-helix motif
VELVYGLAGEREETLAANAENLGRLAPAGKIRGIIARRLVPVPGTPLSKRDDLKEMEGLEGHMEMLARELNLQAQRTLAAPGHLIRDVFPYRFLNGVVMARNLGVNGLELKVHGVSEHNLLQDVRITSVGNGEMEAVAQPLIPKTVSREILRLVPDMTEERIDQFMRSRPEREEDFYQLFEERDLARSAASYFEFKASE